MLENIRLAFQGIWSHKMRSFLTMLGIIIGIASIISIVSTIQGTNEQIKENLIGGGNNTVKVELYRGQSQLEISDYEAAPKGVPVVSTDEINEILKIDGVENAAVYNSRSYADSIYYNNASLQGAQVLGVDNNYFSTCGYAVRTGRMFLDSDYEKYNKVAILDQSAATSLFQEENPLGKTIEINTQAFTIVGIVQKSSEFEPVINSISDYQQYKGNDTQGIVYLPTAAWCICYQYDEPQNVVIRASSTDTMTRAGQKTADVLNKYLTVGSSDSDVKYQATDVLKVAQSIQSSSSTMNNQLIWIASISLLVGGIGVMNIMLVSVTERTSEIGLKKAIGAKKKAILTQFLTEAVVLTSLGGIIGVIAGNILAQVINKVSGTPVAISIPAIILAVLFSMVIGIVFGLLPARKASNLDPIEALRHE